MMSCVVETPLGMAHIEGDAKGISAIEVKEEGCVTRDVPKELKPCADQLHAYFYGELKAFDLSLNPSGTPFQKKVWRALQNIPFGRTMTYLELSEELGNVKAIRAVAAANGKNPLWIVVPCHRVIGSDGSLVGYAGGLGRKQWLLNHERDAKQMALFDF
ncbi:MAG: methylated-DNA--[protein]-cysteine S-methyltransferase [Bacteroidia bacterium]|nr:methylated-DNA--[protein]-cysteine S-methyltransferase [Bacteroidia bacterium]MBT8288338.1 methylated-DNA--[protein]-cysteine S-methyltransferase [Bacteroidia bacterium]NNF83005.1 methylated-DNA--[protein]-cysteine S-methyltransferase [Flavobacteriaceae bacterium]